ncbi:hypothetical protein, partial [Vibrio parahaemolyticus]|uniref:hypothetical protein n=1 Tax=Vibrio parahaemolyticus TaxID=670 RepID=UPI00061AA502
EWKLLTASDRDKSDFDELLIALFILSSFIHKSLTFGGALNALLRGEQRNTKAAAYHLKH